MSVAVLGSRREIAKICATLEATLAIYRIRKTVQLLKVCFRAPVFWGYTPNLPPKVPALDYAGGFAADPLMGALLVIIVTWMI